MMKGNSSEGKENAWTPITTVSASACYPSQSVLKSMESVNFQEIWPWVSPSLMKSAPLRTSLSVQSFPGLLQGLSKPFINTNKPS